MLWSTPKEHDSEGALFYSRPFWLLLCGFSFFVVMIFVNLFGSIGLSVVCLKVRSLNHRSFESLVPSLVPSLLCL